jgi:hypothetical protein
MLQCTCINIIISLTLRTILDWICHLTTASLYWFIETIIEPNVAIETFFNVIIIWFLAPPLLITNLLSTVLPTFYSCQSRYQSLLSRTKSCSASCHGKRGRHTDRHNTWWHSSAYNKKYNYKEDSPRMKSRRQRGSLCSKERAIRQKIDLLKYVDPIIILSDVFVIDDDVFYDAVLLDCWLPSDISLTSATLITTTDIDNLLVSIDVISHFKQLLHLWSV